MKESTRRELLVALRRQLSRPVTPAEPAGRIIRSVRPAPEIGEYVVEANGGRSYRISRLEIGRGLRESAPVGRGERKVYDHSFRIDEPTGRIVTDYEPERSSGRSGLTARQRERLAAGESPTIEGRRVVIDPATGKTKLE